MKRRLLKRSLEYKARVRAHTLSLAERYRPEVAEVFLARVKETEELLAQNNFAGTDAPYILAGQQVVLKELHFSSGPAQYCLIYQVTEQFVELISLWHGEGSRQTETLERLWRHRK